MLLLLYVDASCLCDQLLVFWFNELPHTAALPPRRVQSARDVKPLKRASCHTSSAVTITSSYYWYTLLCHRLDTLLNHHESHSSALSVGLGRGSVVYHTNTNSESTWLTIALQLGLLLS